MFVCVRHTDIGHVTAAAIGFLSLCMYIGYVIIWKEQKTYGKQIDNRYFTQRSLPCICPSCISVQCRPSICKPHIWMPKPSVWIHIHFDGIVDLDKTTPEKKMNIPNGSKGWKCPAWSESQSPLWMVRSMLGVCNTNFVVVSCMIVVHIISILYAICYDIRRIFFRTW